VRHPCAPAGDEDRARHESRAPQKNGLRRLTRTERIEIGRLIADRRVAIGVANMLTRGIADLAAGRFADIQPGGIAAFIAETGAEAGQRAGTTARRERPASPRPLWQIPSTYWSIRSASSGLRHGSARRASLERRAKILSLASYP